MTMMDLNNSDRLVLDYGDGLKRFSNMAALYHKHLKKFLDDTTYRQLAAAMEEQDYELAFRQAHTLKGVAGNLSLAGLYNQLIPFVEGLRNGADIEQAKALLPKVEAAYLLAIEKIRSLTL